MIRRGHRGHRRYRIVGVGIGFLVLGAVLGLLVGASGRLPGAVSALAGSALGDAAPGGDHGKVARLQDERDRLAADGRAADGFAGRIGPVVVRGALPGTPVTVMSVGGDPADADAVAGLIGQAGGRVAGRVRLTGAVTDPARADQLRDLAARLLPAGAQLPASSDAGTLTGGLLGSALLIAPGGAVPGSTAPGGAVPGSTAPGGAVPGSTAPGGAAPGSTAPAQSVLAGLTAAGFAEPGPAPAPGSLVVVLTGGAADGLDAADVASTSARLASELDRRGGGAVLAGRDGSADPAGPVGVVRADPALAGSLSTVDDVQSGPGRIATVLALAEQADGRSGHYGAAPTATAPVPAARP